MSKNEEKIEVEGTIVKTLPGLVFDVQLPANFGGQLVKGYLSGKMKKNFIKLIEGDKVVIELSPYDLSKGRITLRINKMKESQV